MDGQILSDAKDSGKGWLSSHMAQFMVFLNGLILTLTAFFTLSVFINEMQSESARENTTNAHSVIQNELAEIENSFEMVGALIEQKGVFDVESLEEVIPNVAQFKGIRFSDLKSQGRIYEDYKEIPNGFSIDYSKNFNELVISVFNPEPENETTFLVLKKRLEFEANTFLLIGFVSMTDVVPNIVASNNLPVNYLCNLSTTCCTNFLFYL